MGDESNKFDIKMLQEMISNTSKEDLYKMLEEKADVSPQVIESIKSYSGDKDSMNSNDIKSMLKMIKPLLNEEQQKKLEQLEPMLSMVTLFQGMGNNNGNKGFNMKPKDVEVRSERKHRHKHR